MTVPGSAAAAPPTVLVAEFMEADGLAALSAGAAVAYRPAAGEDRGTWLAELAAAARGGLAAVVVRNRAQVDAEALRAAGPSLRVVGRLGVGLDNIDAAACREAGVAVVSARGSNADAVCEYVFAAVFHLARRLGAADAAVRAGGWPRQAFIGAELAGRTMGIVGFGDIGRRLAVRAEAFGMRVVCCDPYLPAGAPAGVPRLRLAEVVRTADILSLHVPLTPETRGMIGTAELSAMPDGAVLVNAARGGIVDEDALFGALSAGRLGGAALDVRTHEPPQQPDPLAAAPRLLLTPHIAGWTAAALRRIGLQVAAGVLAALGPPAPR